MRVTNIVLHWEGYLGMQLGIDIGNESDEYRLTLGEILGDAVRY